MISSQDQSKWDSLQDAGSASIDKILAGKGSPDDVATLARLVAEQHDLAGQIFEQGVQDAEQTADTIVDALNKKRIDSGKKPLSGRAHERVYKVTLQQVMSQAIEDILGSIKDQFEEQEANVRKKVGPIFERLHRMTRRGQTEPQEEAPTPARESFLKRLMRRRAVDPPQPRQPSLYDRFKKKAGDTRTAVVQSAKAGLDKTKDLLANVWARVRAPRSEDSEEKRSSIWLRKLKAMFDPFKKGASAAKKGAGFIGGLLGMLAKPLLLALMSPQLIKTITDAVSKYLNFDSISSFVSQTWEDTKAIGSDLITWIVDKVGSFFGQKKGPTRAEATSGVAKAAQILPSTTPEQARSALPAIQQKIEGAKKRLASSEKRYAANPTESNKKDVEDARQMLSIFQNQLVQYQTRSTEPPKTMGSTMLQPKSVAGDPTTATLPGGDAPSITTNVMAATPSQVAASSSASPRTTVSTEMPQLKEGKAIDVPPLPESEEQKSQRQKAATAQIGLGSFGYGTADDSLNILNLGMIA